MRHKQVDWTLLIENADGFRSRVSRYRATTRGASLLPRTVLTVPYCKLHVRHGHRGTLKRNKAEPAISQKACKWQRQVNREDVSRDYIMERHRCKGFPCAQPVAQAVEICEAVQNASVGEVGRC